MTAKVRSFLLVLFFVALLTVPSVDSSRVYIDVNAPNIRPLPIAIQTFSNGKEIAEIIVSDLNFTGLFYCLPEDAQVEKNEQPFNARSWLPLNTALVVKGNVTRTSKEIKVAITAYDVQENREVLRKDYSASQNLLRPLAHSISNDIYKLLTNQKGIFRSRIAFVVDRGKSKEIHISDYDGHRIINTGINGGVILSPRWSPDGRHLLYSAERNRYWEIYLLNLEDMRERNLVSLSGLNITGNFFPNGQSFVFASSRDGKTDIHRADIGTMKGYKIIGSPWIDISPAISPDGKSLLFVSNRSGSPQIYISDSEGNGVRRLTFEGGYNTSPAWSPTGDRVVFTSMIAGKQQVFIMKADGTSVQRLTDKGNNEDPSFSPDGRYIVFTSDREGSPALYIMRANGEGQVRITPRGIRAYGPSWSPN